MGGIFEVLDSLFDKYSINAEFTKDDILEITGLSYSSVCNNLNKLVKYGFLSVRYEGKPHNGKAYYKIKGAEVERFITTCLRN